MWWSALDDVCNINIFLSVKTDYLKMLSAIIVALFLGIPYLKAKFFPKQIPVEEEETGENGVTEE
mgnify:CR=1 FL=1